MNIINYKYKGSEISFMSGNNVMINATQMAKPFNKRPNDYLGLPSTNELISAITRKSGIAHNQLVNTIRGGLNPGTWLHEDIALDFAQWLSVDFKLWCNDRIKELLKTGVATVSNDDEAIAYAIQVLNKRLEQSRIDKELLEQQNTLLANELRESRPKLQYVDAVLNAPNTYTSTQIAKETGLRSAEQLHTELKKKGVMFNQSGQWVLTAKYCRKGYTKPRTCTYLNHKTGLNETNTITTWTEKGRAFIHSLLEY